MKKILAWIVILFILIAAFALGKRYGSKTVTQQVVSNSFVVKEIAELATLEVRGTASIKRSNIENSGDWTDNLKKTSAENTVWVNVPYIAKYGVDLDDKNFKLHFKEGEGITIELPAPKLLSYELRLNEMEASARKGWFTFSDDETYTEVQKKLYQQSRQQLAGNKIYTDQSKKKIKGILENYYSPLNIKVTVRFDDEKMDKITLP